MIWLVYTLCLMAQPSECVTQELRLAGPLEICERGAPRIIWQHMEVERLRGGPVWFVREFECSRDQGA